MSILVSGFVVGALGRLAVPGPDPMPFWLTIGIGVLGSFLGGGFAAAVAGPGSTVAILVASVVAATALVIAYRRFFQGRGITGPEAQQAPRRGLGIGRRRGRQPLE